MFKRCVLFILMAVLLLGTATAQETDKTKTLLMHPGETMALPGAGTWAISDDTIAAIDDQGNIKANGQGSCQLTCTLDGQTTVYSLFVSGDVPTELMKKAIAAAENEFVTLDGRGLKRANKYTKWYAGKDGVSFGWCGAFVGYCLQEAGIPMSRVAKAEKVDDSATFGISEAAVGKILKGYQKMERTTNIPRPGYIVIYSVTGKSYNNIHTGMVVDVKALGDGRFLLTTIEGNVSSRVKKYQYYYDSNEEAATKMRNMQALPEELQTDEKVCYKLHDESWYIKVFCQPYI